MLNHDHARLRPVLDPADWEWHVLTADRTWLARPAPQADAPPSNAETWTRRIPDSWAFDSEREARDAAIAHGADPKTFSVIAGPRRGGQWLRGEGVYGPKPVTGPR